ncbi:glycosyltransferase family 4 protein [Halomonas sp. 1390]|uniref:glycosyltransferase family 4 protein n=1 Tax=Halomonas sp. B23F22_3 TaxID=3459516 RepID=UPI00373F5DC3
MNSRLEASTVERDEVTPSEARPLRVLLWCPYGITMSGGGAGINSQRLYQAAQQGQVHVTVAHGLDDHPTIDGFADFVRIARLSKPSRVMEHLVFLGRSWLWLRRHVDDYDVFHGIDAFEATISPAAWAKRRGVPVIIKPANQTSTGPTRSWRRLFHRPWFRARAMARMDGIVAISQTIHDDLRAKGIPADRVVKIPNGIDCRRYSPLSGSARRAVRELLGMPADEFCLLSVAGLRPTKRIEWSLEALALLVERGDAARLYLVGNQRDEIYRDFLMDRVKTLGLQDRVVIVGEVDDTAAYYQAADAFCLTSKNEGMPNALLEAMACGQCCLVTPVSGSKDIVDDGVDGYFIASPGELAERLAALMHDAPLRSALGEAARLKALDYSLEGIWGQYFALLRRVSHSRAGVRR